MVFRELLRTCPEQRASSVDRRREWFLGKLTAESPEKVLAYLRPLAIAFKLRPVHTVLTEENWRSLMVMVDPQADADDRRQTLVDLGFPPSPKAPSRRRT